MRARTFAMLLVLIVPFGPTAATSTTPTCQLFPGIANVITFVDNDVIENLFISGAGEEPSILVVGAKNVTIRNCEIYHGGGPGIRFVNAPGLRIENVRIINLAAPPSGPHEHDDNNNIEGEGSKNVTINCVTLSQGSTGIYLLDCRNIKLTNIEGHDFRGPFPRGQLVQFNRCKNALLDGFSCENPPDTSWCEDHVSVFESTKVVIRNGLVDGNNSPSGVGVMAENSKNVLIADVDAINQGNGSFGAFPGTKVTFLRTRARDNICGDQGRGLPLSGGLSWSGEPTQSRKLQVLDSHYWNLCHPGADESSILWEDDAFKRIELTPLDFTPRAPIRNAFCWDE